MAIEITKESLILRIQTSVLGVFRLAANDNSSTTIVLHALQGIDSHLSFQRRNLVAVILLWGSTTEWWVCHHHVNVLVCKRLGSVLTAHVLEALSSQVRQSLGINIVHMHLIHWQTDSKHTVTGTRLQSTLNHLSVALHIHIRKESVRGRGRILLLHHSLGITLVEARLILVERLDTFKLHGIVGRFRRSDTSCTLNNGSLSKLLQIRVLNILQANSLSYLSQLNDSVKLMLETQLKVHGINKLLLCQLSILGSLGITHKILLMFRRSLLVVVSPILQAHALLAVTIADIHHLLIDGIHIFFLENLGSRRKLLAHFLHHVFKIVHAPLDSQISILSHGTNKLRQQLQLFRVKTNE